jgi:phosphomevalonate kinase
MHSYSEPFRVLAPGKLVIAGEYAVLDGAPALVLAIDRGVACDVRPASTLRVDTPDGDTRFVSPALEGAPPAHYSFHGWNPPPTSTKAGFGGSAAACVAACIAAGRPPRDALTIHKEVQGSGSGVDIASSIAGGMIRFQQGIWRSTPAIRPLVVWSGQSAQTGPRVEKYLRWSDRQNFIRRSEELLDSVHEDPIRVLREIGALLRQMTKAAGIDYLSPALERIQTQAEALGGTAKPSGAGGGDCAVVFLPDVELESRFLEQMGQDRLQPISIQVAEGAHRTALPSPG